MKVHIQKKKEEEEEKQKDTCPESDTWLTSKGSKDSIRCYSGKEQAAGLDAEACCRIGK